VTNSSNAATITNLANKASIHAEWEGQGGAPVGPGVGDNSWYSAFNVPTTFARTIIPTFYGVVGATQPASSWIHGVANGFWSGTGVTRYSTDFTLTTDWSVATVSGLYAYARVQWHG